ncbi:MAG: PaaI family thioesterase [Bacteroidales bacterium]|nr:PaaI family thioesterase [Bacteroidales bacterium]
MENLFEFGAGILNAQPFSQLLGVKLVRFEPGKAEMAMEIDEKHKQQHGFVHGGVISYLADNCLTFAGGSVLGDSLTVEYKINYLKPAKGEKLIARGSVISSGKTQAVSECKIYSLNGNEEKLIAAAQGTIVSVKH